MIARAALAAQFLCGACLSDLERPASDGGSDDGGVTGDGGPDRGRQFPDGVAIRRNHVTADLDGDDATDVVLLDGGDNLGVYVVLGGGPDPFLTRYHSFFDTGDCDPVAVTATDFMDDAADDLLVMCQTGDQGHLLAFAGNGDGTFDEARDHSTGAFNPVGGTVDAPEPIFLTTARLRTGGGDIGAVFGQPNESVYAYLPGDWAEEDGQPVAEVLGEAGNWTTPNAAIAVPGTFAGLDDIVVVEEGRTQWARRDDDSDLSFVVGTAETFDTAEPRFVAFAAVSEDDYPDAVTGGASGLLHVVSLTGQEEAELLQFDAGMPVEWSPEANDDLLVLDLGASARPELVLIDAAPATNGYTLWLLDDLLVGEGGTFRGASGTGVDLATLPVDDGRPNRIVGGNFDGQEDAELWVFDAALDLRACYHACDAGAGLALFACTAPCGE